MTGERREMERGRLITESGGREEEEEEVKEIDRVEPRQMSGIDDARSNAAD